MSQKSGDGGISSPEKILSFLSPEKRGHRRGGSLQIDAGEEKTGSFRKSRHANDDNKTIRQHLQTSNLNAGESIDQRNQRIKVLEEILSSEKLYANDLDTIVNAYLLPLRKAKDVIPTEDIQKIFSNIELILNINSELVDKLDAKINDKNTRSIEASFWEIFSAFADNLKTYSVYCNEHAISIETAVALRAKNPAFAQFCEKNTIIHNGLRLEDYLIKPVQRICKYPLMFKELLKCTPENHSDYEKLRITLQRLEQVAVHINEAQKKGENKRKLQEIDSKTDGFSRFIADERWFIREGALLVGTQSHNSSTVEIDRQKKPAERFCYLLSDYLLICKKNNITNLIKKKPYKVRDAIPLKMCLMLELDIRDKHFYVWGFQIQRFDEDKQKYYLYFQKKDEKEEWWTEIEKTMQAAQDSKSSPNPKPASSAPRANTTKALLASRFGFATKKRLSGNGDANLADLQEELMKLSNTLDNALSGRKELEVKLSNLEEKLEEEKKIRENYEITFKNISNKLILLQNEISALKSNDGSTKLNLRTSTAAPTKPLPPAPSPRKTGANNSVNFGMESKKDASESQAKSDPQPDNPLLNQASKEGKKEKKEGRKRRDELEDWND